MNILLLTPDYMGLYKPIEQTLIQKGHNVFVLFDGDLPHTPFFRNKPWPKQILKHIWFHVSCLSLRYWKKKINETHLMDEFFDLFICINGCCVTKYFISFLKKNNPKIKMVMYLWDTIKFYNYESIVYYFDMVPSFDYEDALKCNWIFLPFYWVPYYQSKKKRHYLISTIGANHDGRLEIVSQIAKQLDRLHIDYYFGIFIGKSVVKNVNYGNNLHLLRKVVSTEDTLRLISESDCILDTDRPTQTGTTPRLIWALAMGKKIITTNTNIVKMPFFNAQQIAVISRDNPIVDMKFCTHYNSNFAPNSFIESLRIDKWVNNFLN